jgi:hypothetical protein
LVENRSRSDPISASNAPLKGLTVRHGRASKLCEPPSNAEANAAHDRGDSESAIRVRRESNALFRDPWYDRRFRRGRSCFGNSNGERRSHRRWTPEVQGSDGKGKGAAEASKLSRRTERPEVLRGQLVDYDDTDTLL